MVNSIVNKLHLNKTVKKKKRESDWPSMVQSV